MNRKSPVANGCKSGQLNKKEEMKTAGEWHLVFNKKTGIWGTEHSEADDFAAAPMTMTTNPESVERFTVELSSANDMNGTLKATWGTAVLTADFTASNGAM